VRAILLTILVAAGLLTATGTASAASRYWDTDFGHYGSYAAR
jgi:hypothetical protein